MDMTNNLTTEHLEEVLDNAPVAVMVSAMNEPKLLYANRLAKEMFPNANKPGALCYRVAGFSEPCPFCSAKEMSRTELKVREYRHPASGRTYRLSGKLIHWAGESAHIEYVADITMEKQEEDRRKKEESLKRELITANEKILEKQQELDYLVNSIPGGIASYRVEGQRFIPTFFSDGVTGLSGHSREEYERMVSNNVLDIMYELDRDRVLAAVQAAYISGEVLDISYRMRHKKGHLIWIHLNGRRIGPLSENGRFYAVFTGMSAETRLFQSIADETADGIYVIDKRNHELLYANQSGSIFGESGNCLEEKCYAALYGKDEPCEFCNLESSGTDGKAHEMAVKETGRFYSTRLRETLWNGIPAYVKYVRDITDEVLIRREKDRLEMYFKNVVDKLPGGVSVIRVEADGSMTPEFISHGFGVMTHMTVEEAAGLYKTDILAGVYPDDIPEIESRLKWYMEHNSQQGELVGRMLRGDGGYVWVRNNLSIRRMPDGVQFLYCVYTDISKDMEEKAQIRRQYEELLLRHYRMPEPGTLIAGHSDITKNKMLEIRDYMNTNLLETLGTDRAKFFAGIAECITDEQERKKFAETFYNQALLEAFAENHLELELECFVKLPHRKKGCYARFKVNLVEMPDTGDVTEILTVSDITERIISGRILNQLSVTSHDYIIDVDLGSDAYQIVSSRRNTYCIPPVRGCYSAEVANKANLAVAPKDKALFREALDPESIHRRLMAAGAYTFTYSITSGNGDIRTKNMTVSSIDARLDRVCLICTDITESVRAQQGLLNMIAYTFDLAGLINVNSKQFTMYTRQMILENLPPHQIDNYDEAVKQFILNYEMPEGAEGREQQFSTDYMLERLGEKPSGYDFVAPYRSGDELLYKQVNVLWGDSNQDTICIVRADVTDMLTAERQSQKALEIALETAENANRAKSEFLSAMSHDIRTPMNAIMGMTMLASSYLGDRQKVEDCLQKISISSRHLLSLINDVLDMSRIERSQISLNPLRVSLPELMEEISAIISPQAQDAKLQFTVEMEGIVHERFYGDSLRVSQILINLLSNAVKFTPEGGSISLLATEMPAAKGEGRIRYRFTVKDTGIGMSEEFKDRVFAPFTRDSNVLRIEGTGLGLSITRGLVDLMEGSISLESKVNEGTVFQVELEFEEIDEKPLMRGGVKDNAPFGEDCLCGRRFLAAEDNAINAEILREILAIYGAETVIEANGALMVQAFKDSPPGTFDAIFLDIQMPVMDGFEAARAIRALKRPDSAAIPIIAMTANAFAEDIQASLEAGMNAHVAKPIDVDVLRAALSKVIKEHNSK